MSPAADDTLPKPGAPAEAAEAEARLARLGVQIESMQGVLVRLLQDVVRAENRLEQSRQDQLVAVNEQLVVAALTSQADAEASRQALYTVTQSALHDPLTGLPNRTMLRDHFAQAQAQVRRHGGHCALLFLDLDDFKRLNDAHGHGFGDLVLREVADRLSAAVREVDTVSRHGGDEFVVLLAELSQPADARQVAEKLRAAIAAPMTLAGQTVALTASVGIALSPEDGDDLDTLATHADAAMYAAKRSRAPTGGRPAPGEPPPAEAAQAARPAPDSLAASQAVDLRAANEHLVLAALDAQALLAAAELARQRQTAFLAAVAEELRNPLSPIRIATAMLGRVAETPLLPRVQALVSRQMAQVARLVDAVSIAGGGLHLKRAPVDLAMVLQQAVGAVGPAMAARAQQFSLQAPDGPWPMLGDAERLRLVIDNLLDNALRYTPEGGRIDLRVEVDRGARRATLTLTDTGIGIAPKLLPLVFEPFMQDPRALVYNPGGLGIGLTVARALAQAHGGQISAHCDPGQRGSRFVLTLPLAAPADGAPADSSAPTGPQDAGRTGA